MKLPVASYGESSVESVILFKVRSLNRFIKMKNSKKFKYVIIGNSFAALFAVESIRKSGAKETIAVISDETEHTYSRAMLHEYVADMVSDNFIYLRDFDYYQKMNVTPILGSRVSKIDSKTKKVYIGKESIGFEKLLISAGGVPFIPPGITGLNKFKNVFTFTKKKDADKIKAVLKNVNSIAILGGGLIGLQCAEGLAHTGKKVTVVELADNILPIALDDEAAKIARQELHKQGIEIITKDTIVNINGSAGKINSVTLKSEKKIPCQMVVIAVGVKPNIEFLNGSGIKTDRGILVNSNMETNIKNIYAAGDCTAAKEMLTGKTMPIPIIPLASQQGMTVGCNMAGKKKEYKGGLSLNALQFGGAQIISYGFIRDEANGEILKKLDEKQGIYKKIIIKKNKITGAVFVRAIERAGIFRYLIENKVDVGKYKDKLLEPDFNWAHIQNETRDQLFLRSQ